MPLRHEAASSSPVDQDGFRVPPRRQQSGHSELARYITSARQADGSSDPRISQTTSRNMTSAPSQDANTLRPQPASRTQAMMAANDTPSPTAPPSPNIMPGTPGSDPRRQGSGDSVNRLRATTLDIPGLTKSKVSPDGKISERDIGSKLVIVMGKSTAVAIFVLGLCCLQLGRPSKFRHSLGHIQYVVCCPEHNVLTLS